MITSNYVNEQGIGKSPKTDLNQIKLNTDKNDLNQIKTHFFKMWFESKSNYQSNNLLGRPKM